MKSGNDFVRVATNVKKDDGSRAIGTVLDPKGKAIAAISKDESFYGEVPILGKPYITGYEPIRDANNQISTTSDIRKNELPGGSSPSWQSKLLTADTVQTGNPNAKKLLGTDLRKLKDSNGKQYGEEIFTAGQKPEGQITEISGYLFPKPSDPKPAPKNSFVTKVGDLFCGAGYYK